jgi:hypothetical protein
MLRNRMWYLYIAILLYDDIVSWQYFKSIISWNFMYHFRIKISQNKFTNKSLRSCGDGIYKLMDEHNQLPLPSDTSKHFVQSTGYCNMALCDMVVNDARIL